MCLTVSKNTFTWALRCAPSFSRVSASWTASSKRPLPFIPFVSSLIGILVPRFLNLEWMPEGRWQAVIWIRCFTRKRFSSSRKNLMGVVLRGTSQMTASRNSILLRAAMVVDLMMVGLIQTLELWVCKWWGLKWHASLCYQGFYPLSLIMRETLIEEIDTSWTQMGDG
jgi:hypothetical protein